jgi:hypothetical protein
VRVGSNRRLRGCERGGIDTIRWAGDGAVEWSDVTKNSRLGDEDRKYLYSAEISREIDGVRQQMTGS